jgi:hypothetical protein
MTRILVRAALALLVSAVPASAQQRPLNTEDPETVGAGRILLEGGIDYVRDQQYTVSGLEGHLLRLPTLGVSFGISSIAELQVDGGLVNRLTITERNAAPLSALVDVDGKTTSDIQDLVVATKVRLWSETYRRPAFAVRIATRLPNAGNESGLGTDTIDFFGSAILGKTVQSVRVVGNFGIGILSDPAAGHRSNDVLTYGVSLARAVTDRAELVGELNGRISTKNGRAFPGTETSGLLTFGARYTTGSFRLDAAALVGLNPTDPALGLTGGFTYVFNAFEVP